jgi:hypothetical protein
MAAKEKVSVALGRDELRLARVAAKQDGVSLSAFVTRAVRARIQELRRQQAARRALATFAPEDIPTVEEQRELLTLWVAPRTFSPRKRAGRRQR